MTARIAWGVAHVLALRHGIFPCPSSYQRQPCAERGILFILGSRRPDLSAETFQAPKEFLRAQIERLRPGLEQN